MARSLTVISLLFQSTTHCRYRTYTKFLLTHTAMYQRNRKVLPLGITALQPQSYFHLGTPYTLKQNHKITHMVVNACSVITVAHFSCLMTNIREIFWVLQRKLQNFFTLYPTYRLLYKMSTLQDTDQCKTSAISYIKSVVCPWWRSLDDQNLVELKKKRTLLTSNCVFDGSFLNVSRELHSEWGRSTVMLGFFINVTSCIYYDNTGCNFSGLLRHSSCIT